MRTVATWVRKARAIANEFQGHIEQMVRDAELDEVRKEVEKATQLNLQEEISKVVDPKGELQATFSEPVLSNPLADPPKPLPLPEAPPLAELPAPAEPAEPKPAHEAPAASTHQSA